MGTAVSDLGVIMSLIGEYRSLVDILERHASERPDSLAYVFLEKAGVVERSEK